MSFQRLRAAWILGLVISGLVVAASSCKKKPEANSAGSKEPDKGWFIEQFNVWVKLPKDGKVVPVPGKPRWAGVKVGECTVLLEALAGSADRTYDHEVELATKGKATRVTRSGTKIHDFNMQATKWLQKKRLPDGFLLDFEGKDHKGRTARQVVVRRHIGTHHIRCSPGIYSEDVSCVSKVCLALQPGE